MDQVRPLGARFDRRISDWRTRRGRATAERYLDLLAAAAEMQSWCHLKLYRLEDFPVPVPLLWIYTRGEDAEVGVVISVRATRGVSWAYYDAQRGWAGYIAPCGDMRAAAEQVEQLLSRPFRPV